MTEVIKYQEHLNSHSLIVSFIVFVGLRPKRTETWISNKTFKKKKTVYVARNGDAGEKRKPYQSNSVKWIYRFLIFKDKMQVPITLLLSWITQGSPSRASPYFLPKKCMGFCNIRNCMLKRDMEFRFFYFICQKTSL